jgi:hypothetical protein
MSPSRTVPSRRSARAAGALALALVLAGGAVGCGSGDGDETTTTGGSTATGTTGGGTTGGGTTSSATTGGGSAGGGAPAADEAAIRAAIGRSAAAQEAAGTARITVRTSSTGIETKATGTIDLSGPRFLLEQTVGDGSGKGTTFRNYGEDDKVYLELPGTNGWSVTDNPGSSSDPLAQVRQLQKAKITRVGGTKDVGGATCREFEAEIAFADALSGIDDPAVARILKSVPDGATVPVSACMDDRGLTYASSTSFDLKDLLGEAAAQLPSGRSTSEVTISDYGTAPSPKRPAGIDDAKPLGGSGSSTPAVPTS